MIEGQNAHDKIISDRRSKCMRSDEMKVQSFFNKCFEIDNEWQKAGKCITSTSNLAKVTELIIFEE